MSKKPWFKFDADAWSADPHLRMCSPAAHGLLINLMSIAHGADPYGHIVNGTMAIDEHSMCKIMAWNRQTVGKAWAELEQHGRIVQAESGSWYVPRMVKDGKKAIIDSTNGRKGGNPAVLGVNPPLNPEKRREEKKRGEEKREETETTHTNDTKLPRGEFKTVMLTNHELEKLLEIHGKKDLVAAIGILGAYIKANGKRYKDHYACLNKASWVWDKVRKYNADQATTSNYRKA